jgi:hypothetical protein
MRTLYVRTSSNGRPLYLWLVTILSYGTTNDEVTWGAVFPWFKATPRKTSWAVRAFHTIQEKSHTRTRRPITEQLKCSELYSCKEERTESMQK